MYYPVIVLGGLSIIRRLMEAEPWLHYTTKEVLQQLEICAAFFRVVLYLI